MARRPSSAPDRSETRSSATLTCCNLAADDVSSIASAIASIRSAWTSSGVPGRVALPPSPVVIERVIVGSVGKMALGGIAAMAVKQALHHH
jgi:hypothetical protein